VCLKNHPSLSFSKRGSEVLQPILKNGGLKSMYTLKSLTENHARASVFSSSDPTTMWEATRKDILARTADRTIIATGSLFVN
jgi:malic enzyme